MQEKRQSSTDVSVAGEVKQTSWPACHNLKFLKSMQDRGVLAMSWNKAMPMSCPLKVDLQSGSVDGGKKDLETQLPLCHLALCHLPISDLSFKSILGVDKFLRVQ